MAIRKAERKQAKMRVAISAPSGGGKSLSALKMAFGLTWDWTKIVVIDTENGSGDLYSHLGEYAVRPMAAPFSPEAYIEAIRECELAWFEVIIIDSATHEWDGKGGCLEINDKLANEKFSRNTWSAWSYTTPRHQNFIEAIIQSKCHVIATVRSKTETIQTEDKKVKKVGMKEVQRDGFEYEFTIFFTLDRDTHAASASKDRTGMFSELSPFVITEETGKKIKEWNDSGLENPDFPKDELEIELTRCVNLSADREELKTVFERIKENSEFLGASRFMPLQALVKEKFEEFTAPESVTAPSNE